MRVRLLQNGRPEAIVTFNVQDFLRGAAVFQPANSDPGGGLVGDQEGLMATTSNYALRLLASLKAEAEKVAVEEGTTLNQFINVDVAEKLAALRTARYFEERASRAQSRVPSIVS